MLLSGLLGYVLHVLCYGLMVEALSGLHLHIRVDLEGGWWRGAGQLSGLSTEVMYACSFISPYHVLGMCMATQFCEALYI